MKIIKNIAWLLKNPKNIFFYLASKGILNVDDRKYIEWKFKDIMGYRLDLDNPLTFNEKLQWLKLYDRNPEYTKLVDKYEVKSIMEKLLGKEYIVPTLGIYDSFEEIDFDNLPNEFILKCTHNSGGNIIVRDKSQIDKNDIRKLNKMLKSNYFFGSREWPYKDVTPRIIVEKYLEDSTTKELRDYKFYTFGGQVKMMLLAANRNVKDKELTFDYFDKEGNHTDIKNYLHPQAKSVPKLPVKFKKMVELAEIVSKNYIEMRVDFYEADERIYFGEITFFDQGGYLKLEPKDWELEWGKLINLEKEKEKV